MYPQHIIPLIDTDTTTAKAHPEREQRVPIQHINSTPSTQAAPEQRVSGVNEVHQGSEAPLTQSAEQYCMLQPPAALSPEAVNVPNTPIASTHTFRQTVTRPPQGTDRVTRLDAKKMIEATHAFHTSATLNLDELGKPLKYRSAKKGLNTTKWQQAESEEIQRLLDTHTIRPIHSSEQPIERKGEGAYYNPQVKEKTAIDGSTTYRVRGTIGGDRIAYRGPTTARTAAMPLVKLLIQSVVSDNKRFLTLNIKDFYFNTPLDRSEYLRVATKFLPPQVIAHNKL